MFKNICWVNGLFIIMVAVFFVISISTMLSGCGNKGALYIPDSADKINKTTSHKHILPKGQSK